MEISLVEHAPRGLYNLSPIAAFFLQITLLFTQLSPQLGQFCGNLVPRTSLLAFGLAKSQRRGPGNEIGIMD